MRKSIDGLRAIVEHELEGDAYSGHLFVFVSRRGDRVKVLTWDKGGFVLFCEAGQGPRTGAPRGRSSFCSRSWLPPA
jgi:transposase